MVSVVYIPDPGTLMPVEEEDVPATPETDEADDADTPDGTAD